MKITREQYNTLMKTASSIDTEVMGFGIVKNDILVKLFPVPPQIATKSNVEDFALDSFFSEEDVRKMNFIWHSHCNMTTFLSGGDGDCDMVESFMRMGKPIVYTLVVNKKGEYYHQVDICYPKKNIPRFAIKLSLEIDEPIDFTFVNKAINNTKEKTYSTMNRYYDGDYKWWNSEKGYHEVFVVGKGWINEADTKDAKLQVEFEFTLCICGHPKLSHVNEDFCCECKCFKFEEKQPKLLEL